MRSSFLTLSICLSVFCISLNAQKIPRKLVSVTGEVMQSENFHLSWSVGEAVVSTSSREGYTLTQGFQQPSLFLTDPERVPEFDEVRVFPNPVRDELTIRFDVKLSRSYRIELSSIEGRILVVRDITFDDTMFWWEKIDFTAYSQGLYILHVYSGDERIKRVFKIEKIKTRK